MLREKIVASAARRMIAIADASKRVDRLGAARVPVEILPFGEAYVARTIRRVGGNPQLRTDRQGSPYRTDQGNMVLDCAFAEIADPARLAAALSAIPGLLAHGLFLDEIDILHVGTDAGVVSCAKAT
jgi:ribose 5-phosphate isomerase A